MSEQKAWRSCLVHELNHMLCSPHALLPEPHDPRNTSVPTVNQLPTLDADREKCSQPGSEGKTNMQIITTRGP